MQRDIFVFQCMICYRVSHRYKMTCSNIIDGSSECVPRKKRDDRALTVAVSLIEAVKCPVFQTVFTFSPDTRRLFSIASV